MYRGTLQCTVCFTTSPWNIVDSSRDIRLKSGSLTKYDSRRMVSEWFRIGTPRQSTVSDAAQQLTTIARNDQACSYSSTPQRIVVYLWSYNTLCLISSEVKKKKSRKEEPRSSSSIIADIWGNCIEQTRTLALSIWSTWTADNFKGNFGSYVLWMLEERTTYTYGSMDHR